MATPFKRYLEIKDNYCVLYFGEDKDILKKIIELRNFMENKLKGMKIFIACKDEMKQIVHGKRNIILESQMNNFVGKMGGKYIISDKDSLVNMTKDMECEKFLQD